MYAINLFIQKILKVSRLVAVNQIAKQKDNLDIIEGLSKHGDILGYNKTMEAHHA